MKQTFIVLFSILAALRIHAQTIQEVMETFANDNQNTSLYIGGLGWMQTYQVNTAVPVSNTSLTWINYSGYDATQPFGVGYALASQNGFLNSTASVTGDSLKRLITTSRSVLITRTGKEVSNISFATSSQHADNIYWPVIKLANGTWYAFGTGVTQDAGGSSTTSATWASYSKYHTIDITAGVNWYPIINNGTTLAKSGTAVSLPAGDITGFGVYVFRPSTTNTSPVRIDNFTLYTTKTTLNIPASPAGVSYTGTSPNFSLSWSNVTGYSAASSYEYTIDGGLTYNACTANPQPLTASTYYQPYQCGVRVKAVASTNTYSATAWATGEGKAANLVYKETFPYMGSGNLQSQGWKIALDDVATMTFNSAASSSQGSLEIGGLKSFNPQFNTSGFAWSGTNSSKKFFYTASYQPDLGIQASELATIRYKQSIATAGTTYTSEWGTQVAVQVGGNWYVHNTVNYTTISRSDFLTYDQISVSPSGANWKQLSLTEGVSMSLGGTSVTLPSGVITGIGIYCTRAAGTGTQVVRLDDIEIYKSVASNKSLPIIFLLN